MTSEIDKKQQTVKYLKNLSSNGKFSPHSWLHHQLTRGVRRKIVEQFLNFVDSNGKDFMKTCR